jgi:hypothetical protein
MRQYPEVLQKRGGGAVLRLTVFSNIEVRFLKSRIVLKGTALAKPITPPSLQLQIIAQLIIGLFRERVDVALSGMDITVM